MGDIRSGDPVVIGFMTLCVEGAASGEIVDVTPIGDGVIDVAAYTALDEAEIGAERRSLTDLGYDTKAHTVDAECSDSRTDGYVEMLVEVVRNSDESAMIEGFTVDWEADGASGSFEIPYPNWVCAPGDPSGSQTCKPE